MAATAGCPWNRPPHVHDRHDGNKEAARRYLAWETGLVAQLDAKEISAFRLPSVAR
jgi:hypothetical protein